MLNHSAAQQSGSTRCFQFFFSSFSTRCCCAVQNEAIFLRQKGAVLEQLLEVASEVAVHKREHTGIKFPNLHDPQLLDFLENFLENYGGFGAERPTAQNYFNLHKYGLLYCLAAPWPQRAFLCISGCGLCSAAASSRLSNCMFAPTHTNSHVAWCHHTCVLTSWLT